MPPYRFVRWRRNFCNLLDLTELAIDMPIHVVLHGPDSFAHFEILDYCWQIGNSLLAQLNTKKERRKKEKEKEKEKE